MRTTPSPPLPAPRCPGSAPCPLSSGDTSHPPGSMCCPCMWLEKTQWGAESGEMGATDLPVRVESLLSELCRTGHPPLHIVICPLFPAHVLPFMQACLVRIPLLCLLSSHV